MATQQIIVYSERWYEIKHRVQSQLRREDNTNYWHMVHYIADVIIERRLLKAQFLGHIFPFFDER